MATFKVGDRVRLVVSHPEAQYPVGIGRQGTIMERSPSHDWRIQWDGLPWLSPSGTPWGAYEWQLAPLTPPQENADTWAADKVKQVTKPQPQFTTLRELLEVPRVPVQ